MPIEFRCENIQGFDAALGTYQTCDQKIRAPEKYAGKTVRCPKCSQPVMVPTHATAAAPPLQGQPTDSRPGIMEIDFEAESRISSAAFESGIQRCPKCGGMFSAEGICTLCNYAEPVKQAEREREQKKHIRPAGFQLWVMRLADDPKSTTLIGYCFFAAFHLFALVGIAFGILSLSFVGILLAVAAGLFLVFLWAVLLKTRQLANNPQARLGILAPFWNLVLTAARRLKWEHYDSRLQRRRVLDLRRHDVNDETWPSVDGFKEAQVMDLQGCNISDAGLQHLYGHQHLQCLVIKDTRVTLSAVANLQQALPRVWIWH